MSSTTSTDGACTEGVDLQEVAMRALFRDAAEAKESELEAKQRALIENQGRLDQLATQIQRQPLSLNANRWSSYFNSQQVIRHEDRDHNGSRTVKIYHPWVSQFFDHSPKEGWEKLFKSMEPAPLLVVEATESGFVVTKPGWAKPKTLPDIGAVLTQIVETLTENGVTVKDEE